LSNLLTFQNSFEAAVELIDKPMISCIPFQVARDTEVVLREIANNELKPQVGVMIVQAAYKKARSIKQCCQLAGQRRINVEQKYNSKYCQIYIDRNKPKDCIQIFSKSRKDSTNDCIGLYYILRESLGVIVRTLGTLA
jgi:DNA ligase 4